MEKPELTAEIIKKSVELYWEQAAKEAALKDKNRDFVQIYKPTGTQALAAIIGRSKLAGMIALLVMEQMDKSGLVVTTVADLARFIDADKANVAKAIKVLTDMAFVRRMPNPPRGLVILACDPAIAWTSTDDRKKGAMYHASFFMDGDPIDHFESSADYVQRQARIKLTFKKAKTNNPASQQQFKPPVGQREIIVEELVTEATFPNRRTYQRKK